MMGFRELKVRLLCIVGKIMNKDIFGYCVYFGILLFSKVD